MKNGKSNPNGSNSGKGEASAGAANWERRTFEVPAGSISYIDEGDGPPVIFVHGNPSSSSEFVPAIEALSGSHRCIAVDHIGFGRSDKPPTWDYLPISHAVNLAALLDSLDLSDVTMVVGDWGGPIGLSWALANPDSVRRVILTNTWLWPVNRSLYYQGFSKVMGGPIGKYLTLRHNFFARQVTKRAWGTATPLTPEVYDEFVGVHGSPGQRKGMWVFPQQITGSSSWLAELWVGRRKLDSCEIRILWGMRDIAFRHDVLEVWEAEYPEASVERLEEVGHFPALEATDRLVAAVAS